MEIVIIDDEPIAVALLERLVGKIESCRPLTFSRAAEALEWCTTRDPDLLIVDYLMPEMDGVEFATRFRELPGKAETPMLMITGSSDPALRRRALMSGINDFLTKPFDPVELGARMKNMLALRASQKHLMHRAQLLADEAFHNGQIALQLAARERETLLCLGRAAERRDPETHEHITRMSNYARLIGVRMGLAETEAERLFLAAPLHDVGKLGTPDHILLKPGKLSESEFAIMKQHMVIGGEILSQSSSPILRAGAEIALSHHEKYDGSGYPHGLAGDAIPLFGRIVAVADVFDALTSARPYKPAWEVDRALAMLRDGTGTHFAPECVDAFFDVLDDVLDIKARHGDREPLEPRAAA